MKTCGEEIIIFHGNQTRVHIRFKSGRNLMRLTYIGSIRVKQNALQRARIMLPVRKNSLVLIKFRVSFQRVQLLTKILERGYRKLFIFMYRVYYVKHFEILSRL